jgi:hypothetical protein
VNYTCAFLREHLCNGISRPDNHEDLLRFTEKILGVLAKFGCDDIDRQKIQKRYIDDVLRSLTSHRGLRTCELLLKHDNGILCFLVAAGDDPVHICRYKNACSVVLNDLGREALDGPGFLAAASAV